MGSSEGSKNNIVDAVVGAQSGDTIFLEDGNHGTVSIKSRKRKHILSFKGSGYHCFVKGIKSSGQIKHHISKMDLGHLHLDGEGVEVHVSKSTFKDDRPVILGGNTNTTFSQVNFEDGGIWVREGKHYIVLTDVKVTGDRPLVWISESAEVDIFAFAVKAAAIYHNDGGRVKVHNAEFSNASVEEGHTAEITNEEVSQEPVNDNDHQSVEEVEHSGENVENSSEISRWDFSAKEREAAQVEGEEEEGDNIVEEFPKIEWSPSPQVVNSDIEVQE